MKKIKFGVAVLLLLAGGLGFPALGYADEVADEESPPTIDSLSAQLKILQRQYEIQQEDQAAKISDAPVLTANPKDGFQIKAANGNFNIRFKGLIQSDAKFYASGQKDSAIPGSFYAKRIRPGFEGSLFKFVDFAFTPDFGNGATSLQDAYIDLKFAPEWNLRTGKFKTPFGLERLQSSASTLFVELGLPSSIAPNYDAGIQLYGNVWDAKLDYAVAVLNGVSDGKSADLDTNDSREFAARLFAYPLKNPDSDYIHELGVGVAATWGNKKGTNLSGYVTPAQATFFSYSNTQPNGNNFRFSPQFYYYIGSAGILGEYALVQNELKTTTGNITSATLTNQSWQVAVNYFLTGETPSFKGVTPADPFDLAKNTWGAWELKARYGELTIDPDTFSKGFASATASASKAKELALGINWHLNKNVKAALEYERTTFESAIASATSRPNENLVLSRVQVSY